jgi:type II secretory pathway component GspD/PulD (secretin)
VGVYLFFQGYSRAQGSLKEQANNADAEDGVTVTDASAGKISLDLKGVDISELCKILSYKMQVNIVPTKEVTGRVNIFLSDVTFDDALDIILISNGLAAVKEKNIITVMSLEKYTHMYGKPYKETRKVRTLQLTNAVPKEIFSAIAELKTSVGKVIVDESTATVIMVDIPESLDLMEKTVRTLDQKKAMEIFELKYTKVEDLKSQIEGILTTGPSSVELDARTNKIVIADLPDKMTTIKKVIEAFDEETKQVLIEAQIVQVSLDDRTQTGIDWEKLLKNPNYKSMHLYGDFPQGFSSNYGKFSVGTLASDDFSIVIEALNTFAKTNILSRPRIAIVNNEEASILIGTKEVYFSSTQSQSTVTTTTSETINYVDVGVKLNVTPTITADDYIIMKVRPEVSSVSREAESPLGSTVPVVETSEAETTVKVKNGAMVMIAGLMKEDIKTTTYKIPILGDLPFFGFFFRSDDKRKQKTELAIFLSPHIITGDVEGLDMEREQIKAVGVLTKRLKGRME